VSQQSQIFLDRVAGRLSGEIDTAVVRAAETELLAAAISTPRSVFIIDCAGLTFIDSSGTHMLERVAKKSGKSIQLVNVPRAWRRVFEILDLCDSFGMETTPRAA
jgi:anti-anti-sigma factor